MIPTHILVRYGEIFLKGQNRYAFEKKLIQNISQIAHPPKISLIRGRIIIPYFKEHFLLRRVFGLVSYSPCVRTTANLDSIKSVAAVLLKDKTGTFLLRTHRADKRFPFTSVETSKLVGEYVEKSLNLPVSFITPAHTLYIEINTEGVFLYFESTYCVGGLPTGIGGKVILLLEDKPSILAGLRFMKRGCSVYPVTLRCRDISLSLLEKFSGDKINLHLVDSFEELEKYAAEKEIFQFVSSQMLCSFSSYQLPLTVFRPLISYTEEEIAKELKEYEEI